MHLTAPTILTPRLRLRAFALADFDAFAANAADPIAMADLGVLDARRAWGSFLSSVGMWTLLGAGWWAVDRLDTGALIGQVGVFRRPIDPALEMGWMIFRAHWRQGFAVEAVHGALGFAHETFPGERVTAVISPGNVASRAVATRAGFRDEGDWAFYGETARRYVRDAPIATPSLRSSSTAVR